MTWRIRSQFDTNNRTFNMTPIIDIVFLLIIFFLVVCQFIEAENFPVVVPDECEFAADSPVQQGRTTVTVMRTAEDKIDFAVGAEKIAATEYTDLIEKVAELIDVRFRNTPADDRVVTLRVDKDVCFADAQYVLAGVAASSARDVQLAVLKNKRTNAE